MPDVPTDEELLSVDELRDAWDTQADVYNRWDELALDEIVLWAQRQALARWSLPAPRLISGGERLPEAKDCDEQGGEAMTHDHKEQALRQEHLELLYLADGRDSPDHPQHQLFTGLWQQHLSQQADSTITTDDNS